MELTRITEANAIFFTDLCPEDILKNEHYIKLGVIEEGKPASVCAVTITGGLAHILWLYTAPEDRRRGCASFLLKEVLALLDGLDINGIEVDFHEDEEGLDTLLMEHGFLVGDELSLYRVPFREILYGARMEGVLAHRNQDVVAHPISGIKMMTPLIQFLKAHNVDPIFVDKISKRYSFVIMDSKGTITEGIFVAEWEEGDLHINYLIGDGSPQGMVDLVAALYDALIADQKDEGDLVFSDRLGAAASFVSMLTGNDEEEYQVSGLQYALKLPGQAAMA